MDFRTEDYYESNARELVQLYNSVKKDSFTAYLHQAFFEKKTILDIGAGSGRDVQTLLDLEYEAYGIDSSQKMIDEAICANPALKNRLFYGDLFSSHPTSLSQTKFDGILLSGVIQHIPRDKLFELGFKLKNLLNDQGSLLVSLPADRPDIQDDRDGKDRLFILYPPSEIIMLLERIGFRIKSIHHTQDSLNRAGVTWTVLIFEYSGSESRPIDLIESILNRDSKTASYKFALIRAFCEIARENYKAVSYKDSHVAIPVKLVAEKWAMYYFSLNEIPQASSKNTRFGNELGEICKSLRNSGGFVEFKRRILTEDKSTNSLISSIIDTIKLGPVQYSGSSFGEQIFLWDGSNKSILVPFDVWQEIVIMGHWIIDSILFKWAEFSEGLAKKRNLTIDKFKILSILLENYEPERETSDVRKIFIDNEGAECVWTGKLLGGKFDIDHVIPYSLWKNNDLWNLLPATPSVNNQKRDKLPTLELLNKRKDSIVYYWEEYLKKLDARFIPETIRFLGLKEITENNWQNQLFENLRESIEITAIQRGVERWSP